MPGRLAGVSAAHDHLPSLHTAKFDYRLAGVRVRGGRRRRRRFDASLRSDGNLDLDPRPVSRRAFDRDRSAERLDAILESDEPRSSGCVSSTHAVISNRERE